MFSITPKNTISPVPISEVNDQVYTLFRNRQDLHQEINGFQVYINQYAWDAFLNHSTTIYKELKHEAQGIFLGEYFKDTFGEFAVVKEYSEGTGESSHSYVGMSERCLAEISQKCSEEHLLMLIWIHTHPNFGVFYSGTDVNCLKTNFFMPFQCGIVVDIIRRESKGFRVEDKKVNEFADYFIYSTDEKKLFKPYEHQMVITKKGNESSISPTSTTDLNKLAGELESLKVSFNNFRKEMSNFMTSHKLPSTIALLDQKKKLENELAAMRKDINDLKNQHPSTPEIKIIEKKKSSVTIITFFVILAIVIIGILNFIRQFLHK